jgi:hypothetical protein
VVRTPGNDDMTMGCEVGVHHCKVRRGWSGADTINDSQVGRCRKRGDMVMTRLGWTTMDKVGVACGLCE